MRILAVAQRLPEPAAEGPPLGCFGLELCREPVADRRVIGSRTRERLGREFFAKCQRRRAVVRGDFRKQALVILDLDDDRDALMVLRGRPDHRRPADVDVLDTRVVTGPLQHRRLERIEIHDQKIDRRDSVLAGGLVVLGVATDGQQPAMHARMQRLHAAVHHFRKAGQLGNVSDGKTGRLQRRRRAARRDDLDAVRSQGGRERNETGLVGDRKESSTNALIGHVYPASSKQAVSRSARQNHTAAAANAIVPRVLERAPDWPTAEARKTQEIMPIRQAVRRAWSSAPPSHRTSFL